MNVSIAFLCIIVVGILVVGVMIAAVALVFKKSKEVNLTAPSAQKPDWMRETPPAESVAASLADGKGIQVFDNDAGEQLAAPFAEQIEDILREKLAQNPALTNYKVDLGTAADGSLEIWVNDKKFSEVDALPDDGLKQAFFDAVEAWKSRK